MANLFGFVDIVAIRDGRDNIICLECLTGEEGDNLQREDILRDKDIEDLCIGENAIVCPRCSGIIWQDKK